MTSEQFEGLLEALCERIRSLMRARSVANSPKDFEDLVRHHLAELLGDSPINVDFAPHPQAFPDILLGEFGLEVKFTEGDSWRGVANSISEGMRSEATRDVYVLYGKCGGVPEVTWRRYGDCVVHVRTSHRPRFEIDMQAQESLFNALGIDYLTFSRLPMEEKMRYVRTYARSRLGPGERLWWLEDNSEGGHTLPLQVRLYMNLDQQEKRQLRAEAALLSPAIVRPSRSKKKYDDVALYALTYRGILCPQVRDLFSAGSVAHRSSKTRGGNYVLRALLDIEDEMVKAASYLDERLFVEYWGFSVAPELRIAKWLEMADREARDWKPSEHLFSRGTRD